MSMSNDVEQKLRRVETSLNIHEEKGRAFKIERIKNQCLLLFKLN
jgi:hypothetical protein